MSHAVRHRQSDSRRNFEDLRQLLVVDSAEVEDDLVWDMTEVLTSLCARLYGGRSARTRAQRALRCAAQPLASEAACVWRCGDREVSHVPRILNTCAARFAAT